MFIVLLSRKEILWGFHAYIYPCASRFTFTEDPDFGPFLESVNGLAGNDKNRTYWELLVKNSSDIITRLEVGELWEVNILFFYDLFYSFNKCNLLTFRNWMLSTASS